MDFDLVLKSLTLQRHLRLMIVDFGFLNEELLKRVWRRAVLF